MTFGLPQKNENKLDSATETLPCNRHGPNSFDTFLAIKERGIFSIQGIRLTHISDRKIKVKDNHDNVENTKLK